MSFNKRAAALRLQKNVEQVKLQQEKQMTTLCGKTRDTYWKENVKSRNDVVEFYKTFYPQYPDQLSMAIADHFEQMIVDNKVMEKYKRTDTESKKEWDWQAELDTEKDKAKLAQTVAALERLDALADEK